MKDEKEKRSRFFQVSAALMILIMAVGIYLIAPVESAVLKYKQEEALKNIEHQVSPENKVNVQEIEIGNPLASLEIPAVKMKLPIYEGTSDEVLEYGVGLTEGTGDIKGGKGKNPLLAGHNGISTSLFNDLTKVKKGNKFFIKVNDSYHAYIVKKLVEVDKDELQNNPEKYLLPDREKDQVTLMTCTPRYENTHRYLVTGERIKFNKDDLVKKKIQKSNQTNYSWVIIPVMSVVAVLLVFFVKRRKR